MVLDTLREQVSALKRDDNQTMEDVAVEKAAGQERDERIEPRLHRLKTQSGPLSDILFWFQSLPRK